MKIYKQETVQHVKATVEECWTFFSSPKNLEKITQKEMGFKITDFDHKSMYSGQIIQYKVTPLLGISLSWMTEITQVKENSYFIDEQRFGPYAMWHHEHHFEATEDGKVKMTDIVNFKLPFGVFGDLLAGFYVKNKVKFIFESRFKILEEIFKS